MSFLFLNADLILMQILGTCRVCMSIANVLLIVIAVYTQL